MLKLIYKNRSDLAKKKISLEEAKKNIDKVITEKKELLNNNFINKRYQLVVLDFNRIKSLPLLYNHLFLQTLMGFSSFYRGRSNSICKKSS